jgi:hypothetical protein
MGRSWYIDFDGTFFRLPDLVLVLTGQNGMIIPS